MCPKNTSWLFEFIVLNKKNILIAVVLGIRTYLFNLNKSLKLGFVDENRRIVHPSNLNTSLNFCCCSKVFKIYFFVV